MFLIVAKLSKNVVNQQLVTMFFVSNHGYQQIDLISNHGEKLQPLSPTGTCCFVFYDVLSVLNSSCTAPQKIQRSLRSVVCAEVQEQ
jgi:hypothetical protein